MAAYKKYNGKSGFDAVFHTATGYKCLAKVACPEDAEKNIYFYSKHIVGLDGRPYIEVGYESQESYNFRDLMDRTKLALGKHGFKEVLSVNNSDFEDMVFSEFASPLPNNIEIRVKAGKDGISKVFSALDEFISKECINFVEEQEENVDEILYHSIMDAMGDDLRKGPGGVDAAKKKARDLANTFIYGIQTGYAN